MFGQEVFEDATIELITRRRQYFTHAEFGGVIDIVATLTEEKTKTEFAQLAIIQMRLEPEHGFEIMRADLDRRLTDLERRFRHRMPITLKHTHRQRRQFAAQLDCQRQAGEATAEDQYIAVFCLHRRTPVGKTSREFNVCEVRAARRRLGIG